MAADLFELLGPLSEVQARRLVQLMRLGPDQRPQQQVPQDTPQQDDEAA
jgi:hypothetical protein